MYHLGQKEFLSEWKALNDQNIFVVAQDLDFLEIISQDWHKPKDWCGFRREDGTIRFYRIEDAEKYLEERQKSKELLECNGEYLWAENYIQEFYRQNSQQALEDLKQEADRQGFQLRIQKDEMYFEGDGNPARLYQEAARISGTIRHMALEQERALSRLHRLIDEQTGEPEGAPFLLTKCDAWQIYYPHKSLWNRIEEGALRAGQLAQSGVLIVSIAQLLQDRDAYIYLKRVLRERSFSDWWTGEQLSREDHIAPFPYEGRVIMYGTMEWLNLWEQSDPQWAGQWRALQWKNQCRCDQRHRKEFRDYLGSCSLRDEEILLSVMKRGAASGYMWTDTARIEKLRENPESQVEEWLRHEDEWWGDRETLTAKGIGNVNGMAVLSMGERRIGVPMTVQALCRRRRKNRSLEISSGPIYRKSLEILKEYWESLGSKKQFVVFMERNHNYLEGDSAAAAQFYAVLSAAARLEPAEKIAVTGAMNLQGDIMAVGGITEKIEGCYFSGGRGMIYPEENRRDLALRPSVEKAIEEGKFRLWGIRRIEEGAEILFGNKWERIIKKI